MQTLKSETSALVSQRKNEMCIAMSRSSEIWDFWRKHRIYIGIQVLSWATAWGCGSPVVKVSDHGRHVMRSNPVPLKTRRVGQRCTQNLSRAETASRWCGVPAQVSSASLDHGSKLRGRLPKALV
ncbi:uncharacterized protein TNCV_2606791 [Trichonephila clavipes]|uniref:Uncharacterized protein n=1 Tax=Trichonephila clavipes TaxID=2585209 RepID=A0A8X6V1W3_TRICX|nr:uncharacterized protein TNCV_2606791 [Trichonephila clavipes]